MLDPVPEMHGLQVARCHAIGSLVIGRETRLHQESNVASDIILGEGVTFLLVRASSPGVRKPVGMLRDRERITFLGVERREQGSLAVRPGTAVFEMERSFVARACGMPSVSLRSEFELSNRKIGALAQRLMLAEQAPGGSRTVRQALWLALARSVGSVFGDRPRLPGDGWLNPGALQRTVEMVEREIADDLSVARMAKVAGLGSSAFLRAFRGSTGMTPGDFVLGCRIALARELLTTTTLSISVIAGHAGFKSASHFATTFLARQGLCPTTYRHRSQSDL